MFPLNTPVDFSRFVALGDSVTAGYKDGALFYEGQISSYPNLMAQQFPTEFHQPLMHVDSVGIGFFANSRMVLVKGADNLPSKISYLSPKGDIQALQQNLYSEKKPFNNLGIPGAKVISLVVPGYADKTKGEGNFNPFFARIASDPAKTSILMDAVKLDPTFFSLFIGNNDLLSYALSGGTNDVVTPVTGPPGFGFEESLNMVLTALTSHGAKGVISNLPSINCIPFFNTINYKDLSLDEDTAKVLNSLYQNEGIRFHAGYNAFLVEDRSRTHGKRQMESGEMVLMEILMDENKAEYLQALKPIPKKYYLSKKEIEQVQKVLNSYNTIIKNLAQKFKLALVDANRLLSTIAADRFYNPGSMSIKYKTGKVFSLDGLHINKLGQALLANEFIKAINHTYGTHIHKLNITNFREKRSNH